jgi:hypothetical protein
VGVNFLSDALSHTARPIGPKDLERLDVLGAAIQFVTDPGEEDAPCIMRGTVPPGVPFRCTDTPIRKRFCRCLDYTRTFAKIHAQSSGWKKFLTT